MANLPINSLNTLEVPGLCTVCFQKVPAGTGWGHEVVVQGAEEADPDEVVAHVFHKCCVLKMAASHQTCCDWPNASFSELQAQLMPPDFALLGPGQLRWLIAQYITTLDGEGRSNFPVCLQQALGTYPKAVADQLVLQGSESSPEKVALFEQLLQNKDLPAEKILKLIFNIKNKDVKDEVIQRLLLDLLTDYSSGRLAVRDIESSINFLLDICSGSFVQPDSRLPESVKTLATLSILYDANFVNLPGNPPIDQILVLFQQITHLEAPLQEINLEEVVEAAIVLERPFSFLKLLKLQDLSMSARGKFLQIAMVLEEPLALVELLRKSGPISSEDLGKAAAACASNRFESDRIALAQWVMGPDPILDQERGKALEAAIKRNADDTLDLVKFWLSHGPIPPDSRALACIRGCASCFDEPDSLEFLRILLGLEQPYAKIICSLIRLEPGNQPLLDGIQQVLKEVSVKHLARIDANPGRFEHTTRPFPGAFLSVLLTRLLSNPKLDAASLCPVFEIVLNEERVSLLIGEDRKALLTSMFKHKDCKALFKKIICLPGSFSGEILAFLSAHPNEEKAIDLKGLLFPLNPT